MGGVMQTKLVTEDLLSYVRKNPGLTAWQISKRLNTSSATVSSRLKKLSDEGKVRREKLEYENGRKGWQYYGI